MDTTGKNASSPTEAPRREGGCHCGAVRYAAHVDLQVPGGRCNCSICTKLAVTSSIVPPDAFTLLAGADNLSTYEWGGKISKRFFCKACGVHVFARGHLAELGGDYVSINLNTLDDFDPQSLKVIYWDGRHNNWDAGPRPQPWPIAPLSA